MERYLLRLVPTHCKEGIASTKMNRKATERKRLKSNFFKFDNGLYNNYYYFSDNLNYYNEPGGTAHLLLLESLHLEHNRGQYMYGNIDFEECEHDQQRFVLECLPAAD